MSAFDPYFSLIRRYESDLEDRLRGVRVSWADRSKVREGARNQNPAQIILQENTAVELGGPKTASSTFTLWTENTSLIYDGRVALAGPEITEIKKGIQPFGQVILVGGRELNNGIQPLLERELVVAEQIPGYMVRSTGGNIWSRVNNEALDNGLNMAMLGSGIVNHIHTSLASVEAAEVLFVTSSSGDVRDLDKIGIQVRKLSHDLRRERLRETAKGQYECENDFSCDACPDSEVCADIREVLVIRKKRD
jgi:CO dehydrogenase/acetyl-CoA synthase beta subunit